MTFFVALRMRSEENASKNEGPTVGFSSTTMLQHTGRVWLRISQQIWQHRSISHTLLTWHQLLFTSSFGWNQHWMDGAFVIRLTLLRMWRKSWKVFHECLHQLYSRWQTYIVAQRNYFEGDVAYIIILLCTIQKCSDSGNILPLPCRRHNYAI